MSYSESVEEYLIGVGKQIRQLRTQRGMYGKELADQADVSSGLISRIENGRTLPSLKVLLSIIEALDADPVQFFRGVTGTTDRPYVVIKPSDREPIEKEEACGFEYELLFNKQLNSIGFEAVILTLEPGSERDKVTTDAFELKYFLEGTCEFVIGDHEFTVEQGDLLYFDGRIPHVPKNRSDDVVRMLVLYLFDAGSRAV